MSTQRQHPHDETPYAAAARLLTVCAEQIELLRRAIDGGTDPGVLWRNPFVESQFQVGWDWARNAPIEEATGTGMNVADPVSPDVGIEVFEIVTQGPGWMIRNGIAGT